jgi:hypothetical protein
MWKDRDGPMIKLESLKEATLGYLQGMTNDYAKAHHAEVYGALQTSQLHATCARLPSGTSSCAVCQLLEKQCMADCPGLILIIAGCNGPLATQRHWQRNCRRGIECTELLLTLDNVRRHVEAAPRSV